MQDDLLPYYERELDYLRKLSKEFAARHPRVAGSLQLDREVCEDPHVERLIEAFAFLTARIHRKLDDEFPEITEAFLGLLYPHFLRPIPPMSIVQFEIDPEDTNFTEKYSIPRGKTLFAPPVRGVACQFRTAYSVELWPVRIAYAGCEAIEQSPFRRQAGDAIAVLRIRLECLRDLNFQAVRPDRLRFFLSGEKPAVHTLYELLFNSTDRLLITDGAGSVCAELPKGSLRQVGFEPEDELLDYDARSFHGYRLLFDYFALPEKFLFFDLVALDTLVLDPFGREMEIAFLLSGFERRERLPLLVQAVNADSFRLGCTPIINLFKQPADPISFDQRRFEYPINPDERREWALEVYSVDSVHRVRTSPRGQSVTKVAPLFSIGHGAEVDERLFWYATRRPSFRQDDPGTEVFITLADLEFSPAEPTGDVLSLQLTCTNRDLASKLPFSGSQRDLSIEGAPLISSARLLMKPTAPLRPSMERGTLWRLISHLSLSHLSIAGGGHEALLEILSLYNLTKSSAVRKEIAGITAVECESDLERLGWGAKSSFCHGLKVEIEFDEDAFSGGGVFLFASVLERFLALYAAVNSFTRLVAKTKQRERVLKEWPSRAGETTLL